MECKIIRAIKEVPGHVQIGKLYYQSFLERNIYLPENAQDGSGIENLNLDAFESLGGQSAYFEYVESVEHYNTQEFKRVEKQLIARREALAMQIHSIQVEINQINECLEKKIID